MQDFDRICNLVEEAQSLLPEVPVSEVIDLDMDAARDFLNTHYNHTKPELIESYLHVIRKLRLSC